MSPKQIAYLKKIKRDNLLILLTQIIIIISFLLTWEFLSKYNIINSFIFSSPSKIIKTFYRKQTQKGRRSANFLLY